MKSLGLKKRLSSLREYNRALLKRNNEVYENKIENEEDKPFAYGMNFYKLFWLFFIGSFFGTVLETFYALIFEGHFEMRVGMVFGPFIPVYGGGAVAITLCLYKLHNMNNIIVFFASAIIGGAFEFFCSYFQEMILGTISWDYSDTPFNIDGRTNLAYSLIWGMLGLLWLRYVYPFISRMIEKIPKHSGKIISVVLCVIMTIGGVLTNVAIDRKNKRAENIPPKTVIGQFCDAVFTDEYMDFIFPHMGTKQTFAEERAQKAEKKEKTTASESK